MNDYQIRSIGEIAGRALRRKQDQDIELMFFAHIFQTAMHEAYWNQIPYSFWPRKLTVWQRFMNWVKI